MLRLPPPLSGPPTLKSTSATHVAYLLGLLAQIDPRALPGAGGVRMTLLDKTWGFSGMPVVAKFGMGRPTSSLCISKSQKKLFLLGHRGCGPASVSEAQVADEELRLSDAREPRGGEGQGKAHFGATAEIG